MKKTIFSFGLLVSFFALPLSASAAGLLPGGGTDDFSQSWTAEQCGLAVDYWTSEYAKVGYSGLPETLGGITADQMLCCALKSGHISFWMLPYFVNNVLNFIIGLAGLIAVAMIMVGAYYYIAGGVTDDKEKGKTIIKFALGGFILVLVSWTLVNVLLLALTT